MQDVPVLIEVVASTVHSCIEAQAGGAGRIELCSALGAAGITPSSGLLEVVKRHVSIPIFAMIRPREGDFTYSKTEIEVMLREIDLLGGAGADGFVLGALLENRRIDQRLTKSLVARCAGLPVTFHRAVDCTPNLIQATNEIVDCGCKRILTSGGKSGCVEGIDTILAMTDIAKGNIVIMPGGGIRTDNFKHIYQPALSEYHLSGRTQHKAPYHTELFETDRAETDRNAIAGIIHQVKTFREKSLND